jgi:dihydrofolate synthase/folylpolyglutamate synthase
VTGHAGDQQAAGDPSERFDAVQEALLERWPEDRIAPGLERMDAVMDLLGRPERAVPAVHVAGTNGKTSTSRMIDALLTAFGLRVGRLTSPHLVSVRERIVIGGAPIDVERFVEVHDDIAPYVALADASSQEAGGPRLSTFEVLTALGFAAFADAPVDAAVIEVGMGGRWDATNVVPAQVAVITPIGLDHQAYLGGTLDLIAAEKAGIIEPDRPAVLSAQHPEAGQVLARTVREVGAHPVIEGIDFGVVDRRLAVGGQWLTLKGIGGEYDDILLPLHGAHQAQNAAVALAALESFLGGGRDRLDPELVRDGFAAATSPGRLEVVRTSPALIVDAAHNPAGLEASLAAVGEAFAPARLVVVLGVLSDKDADALAALLLPVADHVVVTRPDSPRAWDPDDLADRVAAVLGDERVSVAPDPADAVDEAVARADDPDLPPAVVLVTGSIVLVGQVRGLLGAHG